MSDVTAPSAVDSIVARLERLPTSWWQIKARIIVGVATFFDAFDALAIASVFRSSLRYGSSRRPRSD